MSFFVSHGRLSLISVVNENQLFLVVSTISHFFGIKHKTRGLYDRSDFNLVATEFYVMFLKIASKASSTVASCSIPESVALLRG